MKEKATNTLRSPVCTEIYVNIGLRTVELVNMVFVCCENLQLVSQRSIVRPPQMSEFRHFAQSELAVRLFLIVVLTCRSRIRLKPALDPVYGPD